MKRIRILVVVGLLVVPLLSSSGCDGGVGTGTPHPPSEVKQSQDNDGTKA